MEDIMKILNGMALLLTVFMLAGCGTKTQKKANDLEKGREWSNSATRELDSAFENK
jgi:flagellar biosynthesis protein FliP